MYNGCNKMALHHASFHWDLSAMKVQSNQKYTIVEAFLTLWQAVCMWSNNDDNNEGDNDNDDDDDDEGDCDDDDDEANV